MASVSISTTAQKNEFLARLARIESGAASSKTTLFVGLDETILVSNKANAKLKKQATAEPRRPLGLFASIMSMALGVVALGVALYIRFSLVSDTTPIGLSDANMVINGCLGLMIALATGYMLRMPLLTFTPVSAIGVLAGLVGFHNLVHFYPAQFADLFSPVWVEQVVTATDANSIIWRGVSFVL